MGDDEDRVERVIRHAERIWGSRATALRFLGHEHRLLGGRKPIELARSADGARRVERLLAAIEYGAAV